MRLESMASPSLVGLPQELRDQIYDLVLQERRPFAQPWSKASFASNPKSAAFGERSVAYLLPGHHDADNRLFSTIALARSCQQTRHEIQLYLRVAAVDVIAKVDDFDYHLVSNFLQSLPPAVLQYYTVRPERSTEVNRNLRIELTVQSDDVWMLNLTCWLSSIASLFGPEDELATAYKIVPHRQCDDKWNRAPLHIVAALHQMHMSQQPGQVKEELFKIMSTFWGRCRVEEALKHDGIYSMGDRHRTLERVVVQGRSDTGRIM